MCRLIAIIMTDLCSLIWFCAKKVSLSSVKGTGPDGRIVKADIEDYLGTVHYFCYQYGF